MIEKLGKQTLRHAGIQPHLVMLRIEMSSGAPCHGAFVSGHVIHCD